MSTSPIRIKIVDRDRPGYAWKRQIPANGSFSGKCEFVLDRDARDYDWLVVVDDVNRGLSSPPEPVDCPTEHTLLTTTEPQTITRYSPHFSSQFAQVLTSQPKSALPHPGHIYSHPGNVWYDHRGLEYHRQHDLPEKTACLSTLCSTKQHRYTMHRKRLDFTQWVAREMPEMAFYGAGHRPIRHKYEALDPYRYHLVIENHFGPHHWTEKLADAFLCGCLPIYQGSTNLEEDFPRDSFVLIDIERPKEALETIREIIHDPNFYDSRQDAIREARSRVMEVHNLPAMLERIVLEHHDASRRGPGKPLRGRKQLRLKHPLDAAHHLIWKISRKP